MDGVEGYIMINTFFAFIDNNEHIEISGLQCMRLVKALVIEIFPLFNHI